MNVAQQIGRLKATKPSSKHRRCTPEEYYDEELGFPVKMCREDMPTERKPMKARAKKKQSCKQYRWADTKLGRQCVCKSTGRKAASRYCNNKAR